MFIFTKISEKKLHAIDSIYRKNVLNKLKNIRDGKIVGDFNVLHSMEPATHRLRIGDYRLILQRASDGYIVLDIGHRQSVYK